MKCYGFGSTVCHQRVKTKYDPYCTDCYIKQLQDKLDNLKSRISNEEDIRNEVTPAFFVESDIEYLCMLASSKESRSVQPGWFKTLAAKVKDALNTKAKLKKVILERISDG